MIRRTFLKALCASPLGLLLKPKRIGSPKKLSSTSTTLIDPMPEWSDECVEEYNRAYDEVIIRALSKI